MGSSAGEVRRPGPVRPSLQPLAVDGLPREQGEPDVGAVAPPERVVGHPARAVRAHLTMAARIYARLGLGAGRRPVGVRQHVRHFAPGGRHSPCK